MKPKLVLTGNWWPATNKGYTAVAAQLDWAKAGAITYKTFGTIIYEYRVQYQTPAQLSS